jgi:elongation factor P
MASPNEIKRGQVINIDGNLWSVSDFQRVSPGKGGSFVRTKIKSLTNGKVVERVFKANENLTFEDVSHKKMQFIFADENTVTFMDGQTYDQITLGRDVVGDDMKYLKEGLDVMVSMHNDAAISMELPGKIEYTIAESEPAVKGDTTSGNVTKEAITDNGLKIRVPIFLKIGDVVRINTETGDYSERVSK